MNHPPLQFDPKHEKPAEPPPWLLMVCGAALAAIFMVLATLVMRM